MMKHDIGRGDRVRHSRTRAEATVLTASSDGTLFVLLDRHRGLPTWSASDVTKIDTVLTANEQYLAKRLDKDKR